MNKNLLIMLTLVVFIGTLIGVYFYQSKQPEIGETTKEVERLKSSQEVQGDIKVIAQNLNIPREMAFLPDGSPLFIERPGRVRMINSDGNLLPSPIATISEVKPIGEGELLGIAVHPDFENNKYVYLYYTYSNTQDNTLNRVVRYKFENSKLTNERIIVEAIPGAVNHNGGRIKFGPDKFLYITTGDAQNPSLAQDRNSLVGDRTRFTSS